MKSLVHQDISMVESFLPADDPVLEEVLKWTMERNSLDMRRLLEWLPSAASIRERRVLMESLRSLADELEQSMESLAELQSG